MTDLPRTTPHRGSALPIAIVLFLVCALIGGLGWLVSSLGGDPRVPAAPSDGAADSGLAPVPEDFVLYTDLERSAGELPARFREPLPELERELDWTELWTPDRPPPSYARDMICSGDPSMRERFVRGIELGSRRAPLARVIVAWGGIIWDCDDPGYCTWARSLSNESPHPFVRGTARYLLAGCADPADGVLFSRPDTHALAVVRWHRDRRVRQSLERERRGQPASGPVTTAPPARLVDAVIEIVTNDVAYPDRLATDDALLALAEHHHPSAEVTLLGLHRSVPDPLRREQVAMALQEAPGAEAQRIFRQACAVRTAQGRPHFRCAEIARDAAPTLEPAPVPTLRFESADPAVLHQCAEDPAAGWEARECLSRLARAHRPRAGAVARGLLDRRDLDPDLRLLAETLVSRRAGSALRDRLVALGLIPGDPSSCDAALLAGAVTAVDVMLSCRRALELDTEATEDPPEHDAVLRRLAAHARAALDGFEFETRASPFGPRPLHLIAYRDDVRYESDARNYGEVIDVESVLAFANALARERGVPERFVIGGGDPELAVILIGSETALRQLAGEGLISLLPGGRFPESGGYDE